MKRLKNWALAGVLASGVIGGGCLGPNRAFEGVHDWNRQVSDEDWVKEVVFLGLTILPVYSLAYLGDILIFNTIEYWGGSNPIGGSDE